MLQLQFDTSVHEGRVDTVREIDADPRAVRSFQTVRTSGPQFHLMADGSLALGSQNEDHVFARGFGENVEMILCHD